MFRDRLHQALQSAKAPTLERIRQDQERSPHQLADFLGYIAEHLLDPELNVSRAKQATGVRSHSLSKWFRAHMETSPRVYIEVARLEIADRLVRRTDWEMGKIAMEAGFMTYGTFSRAYKAWAGEAPSAVRSKSNGPEIGYPTWRQAFRRELESEAARQVVDRLVDLYPEHRQQVGDGEPVDLPRIVVDGEQYVRFRAEEVWQEIRDLTPDEQKRRVCQYEFRSAALFDLLREKSRLEGRRDRQRGIELAQLALVSLEGSADFLGERIHDLRALGHACVGNALRLAREFLVADDAFDKANAEWQVSRRERDFLMLAKIRDREVALRICQRNYTAAQRLVDEARDLYQLSGDLRGEARVLLQMAAIHTYSDQPDEAIKSLQAARGLFEEQADPHLAFVLYSCLANVLAQVGRFSAASEMLDIARTYCKQLDHPLGGLKILWIDALVRQNTGDYSMAEPQLLTARTGYVEAQEANSVGLISLDLAIFYVERAQWSKVLDFAADAVATFKSLGLHDETLVGINLLAHAVGIGEVSSALLQQVRGQILLDPVVALAL